jgi:calcineurin-like phosphoesterase family protein
MIFFSSDHHFGHTNVIKYCNRPYSNVDDMNQDLVRRWNAVVSPADTVFYLGDFSLGRNAVEEFTPQLNGRKILVSGNHDWTHPVHKKNSKHIEKYLAWGWAEVHLQLELNLDGLGFVRMCHLPHTAHDQRYANFRPKNDGTLLLHGHVHNVWKRIGKEVNMGVDVWDFKPVSLPELVSFLGVEDENK